MIHPLLIEYLYKRHPIVLGCHINAIWKHVPIMCYCAITAKDYVHSPQTQPSAASAMFAELGAGYETISHPSLVNR